MHARRNSRRRTFEAWRKMLEEMPSVRSDDGVISSNETGPVVPTGSGHDTTGALEATEFAEKGLRGKKAVRAEERYEFESGMDAADTAEKLHRGQRIVPLDPQKIAIGILANRRRTHVRRNRRTVTASGHANAGSEFSNIPHQGVWGAESIQGVSDRGSPVAPKVGFGGPTHGFAITS